MIAVVEKMLFGLLSTSISASPPRWPSSFTFKGTWRVPYTNLSNSLEVVQEPKRQYINEHNGLLRIWNTDKEQRIHRKTVVAMNQTICYGWDETQQWTIEFTEFLPDMTGFAKVDGEFAYNGILCDLWEKTVPLAKKHTYRVYVSKETGYPVAYYAKAVSIYGSHYDVYILEIHEFMPYAIQGVWDSMPDMCKDAKIENDPYPGAMYDLFFPKSETGDRYVKNAKTAQSMKTKSYKTGENKFAHMDSQRWLKSITRRTNLHETFEDPPMWDECRELPATDGFQAPVNFSWRDVPNVVGPPRDQVACGSCWAFGTAELLESQFAIKTGVYRPVSVNQVMDCTWDANNFGCQGGEVGPALTSLKNQSASIASEESYPYMGVSGLCNKNPAEKLGKIVDCFHVQRTTAAVKEALYKYGPLAISINVIEEMALYTSGVFDEETCSGADDDMIHIVQLTGWKVIDGKEAWEVKNSWSTYWGDEGYIYIQSKDQTKNCGVTTRAVGVIVQV